MSNRYAEVARKTAETDIKIELRLDGTGESTVSTGIGFFDHMLKTWAKHASFDLVVTCQGDLAVDGHHTVEDVGICLGRALRQCLAGGAGIARYGSSFIPMDEALIHVVVDICGRGYLASDLRFPQEFIGQLESCLVVEFLLAFAHNAGVCLHVRQLAGHNSHHIAEAVFKALAHALRQAVTITDSHDLLSTKGQLDL